MQPKRYISPLLLLPMDIQDLINYCNQLSFELEYNYKHCLPRSECETLRADKFVELYNACREKGIGYYVEVKPYLQKINLL